MVNYNYYYNYSKEDNLKDINLSLLIAFTKINKKFLNYTWLY